MSEAFIGEVRIYPYTFAPKYWTFCNGQLMSIAQNQALFSLLGTVYGGDGVTTFGLPDLRGRVSLGFGTLFANYTLGQTGGEAAHTLTINEIPMHNHLAMASNASGTAVSPQGTLSAKDPNGGSMFGANADVNLAPAAIPIVGSSQPHNNMMPYETLNFCIALAGIYPSRS